MMLGFVGLLAFQFAGEVLVEWLSLPLPGPVLGMVLLLIWLQLTKARDSAAVVRAADAVLAHLQLLFVPAGVGVVAQSAVIGGALLALVVGITVSWALGLAAVAGTAVALLRLSDRRGSDGRSTP